MSKPKKRITEYRNYYLPLSFPVLLLAGEYWKISDVPSERLHFHNCLEIGICHSDSGIMEFYDKKVSFKAGDVTFVPRNVPHTTYSTKGTASRWSYIFLDIEEMLKSVLSSAWNNFNMSPEVLANYNYIFDEKQYPNICRLVNHILSELMEKQPGYQLSVRGLVMALFIELMRIEQKFAGGGGAQGPLERLEEKNDLEEDLAIAPALKYIEENYMMQFPMEQLADLCHLSPTHFRRVFHEIMDSSPLDYLNNTRIMKACSLLRSTEDSILSISEQVGFHSVSSFNRSFQRVMQCAPREYRKNMIQTEKNTNSPSILEYRGWMQPE
ncbi:MAG: helix-turn-helix domain-containing protein [Lachnospiraceae bacterium]|nr:helix-turn-helix domain-containing protein [Lachnospiraceae bacterium]